MQTKKIIEHISNWLGEYLINSRQKGFVIGISGGIDSAVVSTLCAKTGNDVLCIEMPIHQAFDQENRAQEHIEWLKEKHQNVLSLKIDLSSTFDELIKSFPNSNDNKNLNLSLANTRARLRMTTLYYFAGLHNYLVAGTGNKIEDFGVGFFTKYGDGGVDISPIADLTKTEVYALAKELEINQTIQKAKPTDGLWSDDRSDEDQLGASYPELEWAMSVYETHKLEDFSGREKEVFKIYDRLHKAMQHKVNPIPICVIPEELKS